MDENQTPNRIQLPDGFVEYRFTSVPKNDKFSEGVKYGFQYVRNGTEVLRYDNSHGVHERHHIDLDEPEIIDWSGSVEEHLDMFLDEIDDLRKQESGGCNHD